MPWADEGGTYVLWGGVEIEVSCGHEYCARYFVVIDTHAHTLDPEFRLRDLWLQVQGSSLGLTIRSWG